MRRDLIPYFVYVTVISRQMDSVTVRGDVVTIRTRHFCNSLGLHPSRLIGYLTLLCEIGLVSGLIRSRGEISFTLQKQHAQETSRTK